MDYISYIKGGMSGIVGLVISHPFDTIKTNVQANKQIPRNLYKGIASPLMGIGIEKALVFGTYTNMYGFLRTNYNLDPTINNIISGGVAGFCASFIVSPYERIKIMYQTQKKINLEILYPKNFFKGLSATFTREIPGFSIYFSTYTQIEKRFYAGNYTIFGSFVAGGLSGGLAWCFIYPQDLIKTRIQSDIIQNQSYLQILKNINKHGGFRNFYKGFHWALMRAVPLHAGTFATMEFLKKMKF